VQVEFAREDEHLVLDFAVQLLRHRLVGDELAAARDRQGLHHRAEAALAGQRQRRLRAQVQPGLAGAAAHRQLLAADRPLQLPRHGTVVRGQQQRSQARKARQRPLARQLAARAGERAHVQAPRIEALLHRAGSVAARPCLAATCLAATCLAATALPRQCRR